MPSTVPSPPLSTSPLLCCAGEKALEPPKPRANYSGPDDSLVLEDESGRVALAPGRWRGFTSSQGHATAFRSLVSQLVSGVVLGIRGRVMDTGDLTVDDVVVPGLTLAASQPQGVRIPHPLTSHMPPVPKGEPPLFLLLVSGLAAGGAPSHMSPFDSAAKAAAASSSSSENNSSGGAGAGSNSSSTSSSSSSSSSAAGIAHSPGSAAHTAALHLLCEFVQGLVGGYDDSSSSKGNSSGGAVAVAVE